MTHTLKTLAIVGLAVPLAWACKTDGNSYWPTLIRPARNNEFTMSQVTFAVSPEVELGGPLPGDQGCGRRAVRAGGGFGFDRALGGGTAGSGNRYVRGERELRRHADAPGFGDPLAHGGLEGIVFR